MSTNTLERERPAVNLNIVEAARKYLVPTVLTTRAAALKDKYFRRDLLLNEFTETCGLAAIAAAMILSRAPDTSIFTVPLVAAWGSMVYAIGKGQSREAIKNDFELQEIGMERVAHEALNNGRLDDWGKWFNDFFEKDWFPKFPGAEAYYEKYHPRNFSAEFSMNEEDKGRKTLYIRDGYNSVAADDCYYRTTQVIRLQQEKLISEKASAGKVWTISAANIDYLGWEDKGEEKMVDLIKTTTGAISTVYQGELVYAFAGTNDKKLQVILEKAGFAKRGETPEWTDDLDKKALYALDLREEKPPDA